MTGVRRGFVWASAGRYAVMAVNLVTTLVIARLLTPQQYGVALLGASLFAILEAIRALGGGTYLIQHRDLAPADVRTNFTIGLIVTLVLAIAIALLAGPLTRDFGAPYLDRYLQVANLGFVTGAFVYPISALLSRRMAIGAIALIGVLTTLVNAAVSISCAALGFGFMSFAWANALSAIAGMLLYFSIWTDWSIFRPHLGGWRGVVRFGAYDSAAAVLSQIGWAVPYLILGKILNAEAVGLAQRAMSLCLVPEKLILAGVGAVALPAFAQQVREGKDLKIGYLGATELITAAQWPALLLLVVLAGPVVGLVLGPRWHGIVPLVEIIGTALLFSFPVTLHYPSLVAAGAVRFLPGFVAVQATVSILLLLFAARSGLQAAAWSLLLIVPVNSLFSVLLVRHFIRFAWSEFAAALWKSAVCALASAAGPVALAAGRHGGLSNEAVLVAVALSAAGWFAGLWVTRHPLLHEILRAAARLERLYRQGRKQAL